jgi:hypothetical protein
MENKGSVPLIDIAIFLTKYRLTGLTADRLAIDQVFENLACDPTTAEGGGFASSLKILAVRKLIVEHQEQSFDDDPSDRYRN